MSHDTMKNSCQGSAGTTYTSAPSQKLSSVHRSVVFVQTLAAVKRDLKAKIRMKKTDRAEQWLAQMILEWDSAEIPEKEKGSILDQVTLLVEGMPIRFSARMQAMLDVVQVKMEPIGLQLSHKLDTDALSTVEKLQALAATIDEELAALAYKMGVERKDIHDEIYWSDLKHLATAAAKPKSRGASKEIMMAGADESVDSGAEISVLTQDMAELKAENKEALNELKKMILNISSGTEVMAIEKEEDPETKIKRLEAELAQRDSAAVTPAQQAPPAPQSDSQWWSQPAAAKGGSKGGRKGGKGGGRRDKSNIQCHNCDEWGHWKSECWAPRRQWQDWGDWSSGSKKGGKGGAKGGKGKGKGQWQVQAAPAWQAAPAAQTASRPDPSAAEAPVMMIAHSGELVQQGATRDHIVPKHLMTLHRKFVLSRNSADTALPSQVSSLLRPPTRSTTPRLTTLGRAATGAAVGPATPGKARQGGHEGTKGPEPCRVVRGFREGTDASNLPSTDPDGGDMTRHKPEAHTSQDCRHSHQVPTATHASTLTADTLTLGLPRSQPVFPHATARRTAPKSKKEASSPDDKRITITQALRQNGRPHDGSIRGELLAFRKRAARSPTRSKTEDKEGAAAKNTELAGVEAQIEKLQHALQREEKDAKEEAQLRRELQAAYEDTSEELNELKERIGIEEEWITIIDRETAIENKTKTPQRQTVEAEVKTLEDALETIETDYVRIANVAIAKAETKAQASISVKETQKTAAAQPTTTTGNPAETLAPHLHISAAKDIQEKVTELVSQWAQAEALLAKADDTNKISAMAAVNTATRAIVVLVRRTAQALDIDLPRVYDRVIGSTEYNAPRTFDPHSVETWEATLSCQDLWDSRKYHHDKGLWPGNTRKPVGDLQTAKAALHEHCVARIDGKEATLPSRRQAIDIASTAAARLAQEVNKCASRARYGETPDPTLVGVEEAMGQVVYHLHLSKLLAKNQGALFKAKAKDMCARELRSLKETSMAWDNGWLAIDLPSTESLRAAMGAVAFKMGFPVTSAYEAGIRKQSYRHPLDFGSRELHTLSPEERTMSEDEIGRSRKRKQKSQVTLVTGRYHSTGEAIKAMAAECDIRAASKATRGAASGVPDMIRIAKGVADEIMELVEAIEQSDEEGLGPVIDEMGDVLMCASLLDAVATLEGCRAQKVQPTAKEVYEIDSEYSSEDDEAAGNKIDTETTAAHQRRNAKIRRVAIEKRALAKSKERHAAYHSQGWLQWIQEQGYVSPNAEDLGHGSMNRPAACERIAAEAVKKAAERRQQEAGDHIRQQAAEEQRYGPESSRLCSYSSKCPKICKVQHADPLAAQRQIGHAAYVQLQMTGTKEETTSFVADTGAALGLMFEDCLKCEVLRDGLIPGDARAMHSANATKIASLGAFNAKFRFEGCDYEFTRKFQVTPGKTSPCILGADFWAEYMAVFNFATRTIDITTPTGPAGIPFTLGDEDESEQALAVFALEDIVIPPRGDDGRPTAMMIPAAPLRDKHDGKWSYHETWHVEAEDQGATERQTVMEEWHAIGGSTSKAPKWARGPEPPQPTTTQGPDSDWLKGCGIKGRPRAKHCSEPVRTAASGVGAGTGPNKARGEARAPPTTAEECRHQADQQEQHIGSGACSGITHPKWHERIAQVTIPVNVINCSDEPMVIRQGTKIAMATKLHRDTSRAVNQISLAQCEQHEAGQDLTDAAKRPAPEATVGEDQEKDDIPDLVSESETEDEDSDDSDDNNEPKEPPRWGTFSPVQRQQRKNWREGEQKCIKLLQEVNRVSLERYEKHEAGQDYRNQEESGFESEQRHDSTGGSQEGTNVKGMNENVDHPDDDWRRGKHYTQLLEELRGDKDLTNEYIGWTQSAQCKEIKIGGTDKSGNKLCGAILEDMYRRLIWIYREVLSENPKKPDIIPGIEHCIIFNRDNVRPWAERPRPCAPAERQVQDTEVAMLIRNEIVEQSNSPYSNNLVMVKKKDGSTRVCVDFRRLNEVTVFDAYPLTRIDEALDILGKAKVISTIDNSSAFWSIKMRPEDKEKTAFTTRTHGQLQFKRMPFGLKNAMQTYSRAMLFVLRGLLWERCVSYCDDVLIWGKDHEDHAESLHQVLKRYSIHKINIKPSKCHFVCPETEFLGHVVDPDEGVKVNPKKVEAMLNMGPPTTVAELKTFIGMASYYKRFIKDFAALAIPLRRIENIYKTKTWLIEKLWGEQQQRSFVAIRAALASAPVLAFPDWTKPFLVMSDCSDLAKGACLFQIVDGVERPISYISCALNKHEKEYGITDKEGCAATWAIRKFRQYLLGSKTILITDHSALLSLTRPGKALKSMRQTRYAMDLSEYHLEIVHRAGALLHLPDALSRLGYNKDLGDRKVGPTVAAIEALPAAKCTVEGMQTAIFDDIGSGKWLHEMTAAADAGLQEGAPSLIETHDAIAQAALLQQLLEESPEEESRAVEMWNMVCQVARSTRSQTRQHCHTSE